MAREFWEIPAAMYMRDLGWLPYDHVLHDADTMTTRETQTRIIDTALRLFNEYGTAAVSTNRIAEACGISKGNLHFWLNSQELLSRPVGDESVLTGYLLILDILMPYFIGYQAHIVEVSRAAIERIMHARIDYRGTVSVLGRQFE